MGVLIWLIGSFTGELLKERKGEEMGDRKTERKQKLATVGTDGSPVSTNDQSQHKNTYTHVHSKYTHTREKVN